MIFSFLICYTIFLYIFWYCILTQETKQNLQICYKISTPLQEDNTVLARLPEILVTALQPISKNSIFFINTMCTSFDNHWAQLNMQQACAVESAARLHNKTKIYVLFARPVYTPKYSAAVHVLATYDNVHIYNVNIWKFLLNTPAEELLANDNFYYARNIDEQMLELLRVLILWRWGGIVADFSTIFLKSLNDLPANTVGWEAPGHIGENVLKFGVDAEVKAFLNDVLYAYVARFEQGFLNVDMSELLTENLFKRCQFQLNTVHQINCSFVRILYKSAFNELNVNEWQQLLTNDVEKLHKRHQISYVLNTWSKLNIGLQAKPATVYSKFADDYCPDIYKTYKMQFS